MSNASTEQPVASEVEPTLPGKSAEDSEEFIEVNVAASVPLDTAVVLHNFADCELQFHSLIKRGGGIQVTLTPSSSSSPTALSGAGAGGGGPTVVVSSVGSIFGSNLVEYTATMMYIVPKIHTSNKMPQVSSTDVEIIIENVCTQTSGTNAGTRLFLCFVVSTDASLAPPVPPSPATNPDPLDAAVATAPLPSIRGQDLGIATFLNKLDFSSYAPAQFKSNNAKMLPTTTTLTFPGITECLSYRDAAQPRPNTVVLMTVPVVIATPLLRSLNRMLTGVPEFTDFDLQPVKGGVVTRMQFQSNRATSEIAGFQTRTPDRPRYSEGMRSGSGGSDAQVKAGSDAVFALNVVAMMIVGTLFAIPIWVFGPSTYMFGVRKLASGNNVNVGIFAMKCAFTAMYILAAVLVGVGGGRGIWSMLIMGTLVAMYSSVFLVSIVYDIQTHGSIVPGLNVDMHKMVDVFRFNYVPSAPG